jgi:hypothetical protein
MEPAHGRYTPGASAWIHPGGGPGCRPGQREGCPHALTRHMRQRAAAAGLHVRTHRDPGRPCSATGQVEAAGQGEVEPPKRHKRTIGPPGPSHAGERVRDQRLRAGVLRPGGVRAAVGPARGSHPALPRRAAAGPRALSATRPAQQGLLGLRRGDEEEEEAKRRGRGRDEDARTRRRRRGENDEEARRRGAGGEADARRVRRGSD